MTKKRQRIILVCDNCHNRKIKCNRKLPCDSCTNRGIASLCCYTTLEKELAKQGKSAKVIKVNEDKAEEVEILQSRIKELEDVLKNNGLQSLSYSSQTPLSDNSSPNLINHSNSIVSIGTDYSSIGGLTNNNHSNSFSSNFSNGLINNNGIGSSNNGLAALGNGNGNGNHNHNKNDKNNCNGDHNTTDFFFSQGSDIFCTRLQDTFVFSCPISYIPIIKRDVAYILIWHYNRLKAQRESFAKQFINGVGTLMDNDAQLSERNELEAKAYFGNNFIPQFDHNGKNDEILMKKNINLYASDVALLYHPSYIPPNLNILAKINYILPPKEIIINYIEVFFEKFYPFFPIFDKASFFDDINRILISKDSEVSKVTINIEQKTDIAKLGSLLFMLRFTYLYIMKDQTNVDYLNLVSNPIYIESTSYAYECLKEFDLGCKLPFEGLQSFLMAKVYKAFAQDECDPLRETDLYVHSLIRCATTLGLNRDPDIYTHDDLSWLTKTNRRNIWFLLLNLETHELGIYGRLVISDFFADVKLDEININGGNTLYYATAKFMIIRPILRELLRVLLNIQEQVDLNFLTSTLEYMENLVNSTYRPIKDLIEILGDPSTSLNTNDLVELQSHLCLKLFLMKLYLACYLIYERRSDVNLSFKYYKKMFHLSYVELNPFLTMLTNPNYKFDPMFQIILYPIYIRFYFMYTLNSLTAIIHLNYSVKLYLGTEEKPKHFYGLLADVKFTLLNSLRYAGSLSKSYYLAWKALKTTIYGVRETDNLKTFNEFCQGKSAAYIFTLEQIHELCEMMNGVVAELKADCKLPEISDDFQWLNCVPYDHSKLAEENLLIQRYHLFQRDGVWLHYVSRLNESVPSQFVTEAPSGAVSNLINPEPLDPGLDFISGFGSVFQEDYFFTDSIFGPLS